MLLLLLGKVLAGLNILLPFYWYVRYFYFCLATATYWQLTHRSIHWLNYLSDALPSADHHHSSSQLLLALLLSWCRWIWPTTATSCCIAIHKSSSCQSNLILSFSSPLSLFLLLSLSVSPLSLSPFSPWNFFSFADFQNLTKWVFLKIFFWSN